MKKVFAAILALLYLVTSTGATVSIHYCMGKVVSGEMEKEGKCGKCGMKKAKGCCEDKVTVLKIKDSHQVVHHPIAFVPLVAILQTSFPALTPATETRPSQLTLRNNSPPGLSGAALCILHSVFRI